jgi:hypothetical protein
MELPILVKNSKVDYRKASTKDLALAMHEDLIGIDMALIRDSNRISQEIATQALYIIQNSIQLLKHLEDNGYEIDQDIQQHSFKLRDFEKAGKIEFKVVEEG